MRGEQRTPLEVAAEAYRGAIEARMRIDEEYERAQEAVELARRRADEAGGVVNEARKRVVEAAAQPIAKETTTP